MASDLTSASIPPVYRKIFEICSNDGEQIHKNVFHFLLEQCNLTPAQLNTIWDLTGTAHGSVNRGIFYRTLALIAWAQQGRELTNRLFDNHIGEVYPTPEINDLNAINSFKMQLNTKLKHAVGCNYATIVQTDTIDVQLVPEKKGLFIKYSEYTVTSKRFDSKVTRRYNDFVALHELLLNRFPYRLVPSLPPKKIVSDATFLESRRRALNRWLTLICRHPVICHDSLIKFFLTDEGPNIQTRIREIFRRAPDEFTTSDIAASAKDLVPINHKQLAANSQNVRIFVSIISKLKQLTEACVEHQNAMGKDFDEFSEQLNSLSALSVAEGPHFVTNWNDMQKGFCLISSGLKSLSTKSAKHADAEQTLVCERLSLLHDLLLSHKELCDRVEKGPYQDHEVAISKLMSLKKKKLQGMIRGTDAEVVENLESKMLAQEGVITNVELRSDFSLYCVHMETQLVYAYLGTLSSILNSLVGLKINSHSELLDVWKLVQPYAQKCCLDDVFSKDTKRQNT